MNPIAKTIGLAAVFGSAFAAFAGPRIADAEPILGRDVLKFSQRPMDGTAFISPQGEVHRFYGHDELSTAYSQVDAVGATPYRGKFMADDFADRFSSPVVHVKWWGSYLNNFQTPNIPVNKFLISFESDVRLALARLSAIQDNLYLNQIVNRGPISVSSGTFTETPISPGGSPLGETLYEYNAELNLGNEFFQDPDTVYWLKIVALVDLPPGMQINPFDPPSNVPRWGWHNRDYTIHNSQASTAPAVVPGEHIDGVIGIPSLPIWHFQDNAVSGRVRIALEPSSTGVLTPVIEQFEFHPEHYITGVDGPSPIGDFSKDLAFELYTVPEPAASSLLLIAACTALALTRRRAQIQ